MAGGTEIFRVVGRLVYEGAQQVANQIRSLDQAAARAETALGGMGTEANQTGNQLDQMGTDAQGGTQEITQGAGQAESALSELTTEANQAGTAAAGLATDATAADGALGAMATEANQAGTAANNLATDAAGAESDVNQLGTAADGTSSDMGQLGTNLNQAASQAGEAGNRFQALGDKLEKVGQGIANVGASLTTKVTAPILAVGTAGFLAAADIEESTSRIAARLGITGAEAEKLTQSARNIWKQGFGENVSEVGDSITLVKNNLGDLGAEGPQALDKATQAAYTLSKAFDADINESSRAAGVAMKNFGITSEQAMDGITWGFQNGLDMSGEFLDTVREYAPQFSAMGFTFEQALSMMNAGLDAGAWNLDKVGDLIKEANLRFQDMSKTSKDAYAAMGLDAKEYSTAIAEGGEKGQKAFQEVVAGLMAMEDPVKRNEASVAMFGTQFEDLREAVVFSMADAAKETLKFGGAAEEAAAKINDNFKTKAVQAFRSFQDAMVPLGNVVLDFAGTYLPPIIEKIGQLASFIEKLSPGTRGAVVVFALLAAAIGPALVVVGALVASIGAIIPVIAGISAPVLLIIGVIAGLVAAFIGIVTASQTVRDLLSVVFSFLGTMISAAISGIKSFVMSTWGALTSWWAQDGQMIMQALTNIFNALWPIVQFVMVMIAGVVRQYWGIVKTIFSGALDVIMGLVSFFAALFTGQWGQMWDAVKQIFSGALQLVWGLVQLWVLGKIAGIFAKLGGLILGPLKSMASGVKNVFSTMVSAVTGFITKMVSGITSRIVSLVSAMTSRMGAMRQVFTAAFTTIKNAATSQFNAVKNAIVNPINKAKDLVSSAVSKIKGFFSNMKLKIPKITMPDLPHFSLSGKFSLKPPSVPKLSVDWYDKGGIFTGPSVIGVGEKRPEFVGALDDLRGIVGAAMRENQPAAARSVQVAAAATGGDVFHITVDASNIKEMNDLITMAKDFRQTVRRG